MANNNKGKKKPAVAAAGMINKQPQGAFTQSLLYQKFDVKVNRNILSFYF